MRNWLTSLLFLAIMAVTGYFHLTADKNHIVGTIVGILLGAGIILMRRRLHKIPTKSFVGGLTGAILAILLTIVLFIIVDMIGIHSDYSFFVKISVLIAMLYLGINLGSFIGQRFSLKNTIASLKGKGDFYTKRKVLDTSVIIDGRIADISETGFIEGPLIIPQFILKELQAIADSPDSIKRNRGRRGLNILRKMQKKTDVTVEIWEQDFPDITEVDLKLLELAKHINAKLVTNDYNLNKVAQLRGVEILNINELANAMKPVVLPGETMNVKILREGKENTQGIAYLDDGTMVVVDDARDFIDKTINVEVTSVLQTTAGKMIFAKYQEE